MSKEHTMTCAVCGEPFDMRCLDSVIFHEDHEERADVQYTGSEKVKEATK